MLSPFVGGVLIGLSATLLLLLHGRVAGISGILGVALTPSTWTQERNWRLAFLIGLVGVGALAMLVVPQAFPSLPGATVLQSGIAGLLVGYGTRLGSGCTSGHGVCGVSRLSLRSLVATATFIASGAVTVALVQHGVGHP